MGLGSGQKPKGVRRYSQAPRPKKEATKLAKKQTITQLEKTIDLLRAELPKATPENREELASAFISFMKKAGFAKQKIARARQTLSGMSIEQLRTDGLNMFNMRLSQARKKRF